MPPLRDLTEGPRPLPVDVTWSPVHEALAALWTLSDKAHPGEDEMGQAFYDQHIAAMSPDVRSAFESVSTGAGAVWLALFSPAIDLGEKLTPATFVEAVATLPDTGLRRLILGVLHGIDEDLVEGAVNCDETAIDTLVSSLRAKKPASKHGWIDGVGALLATPAGTIRSQALTVLEAAFDSLFADHLDEFAPALERDVAATRELAATMSASPLIEQATNGISYTPQAGDTGYLLIPSAVVRPWTLMLEDRGLRVFVYSVGDGYLTYDPDIPPSWLVSVYKALSDERRLRVLRRLADEPMTLGQLADHIGVAKSTMHHHVGILRRAGLIRVTVGDLKDNSTYSLRPEVLPEMDRLLGGYLEHDKE